MRKVDKVGLIGFRCLLVAGLSLAIILGPVVMPAHATDVSTAYNYSGTVQPSGIAPTFVRTGEGADAHTDPAVIVTTRRSNCNQENVDRITATGARTTLATLPRRTVCPHTDVAVNVDGDNSTPFTAAGFFLHAFVSQDNRIYRVPPAGGLSLFATLPGCTQIISLLFDTVGEFGELLLAVCTFTDAGTVGKVYKVTTAGAATLVTDALDDSISQASIAPQNWIFGGAVLRGQLLVYERDGNRLAAVSGTGIVSRYESGLTSNTELVRVHRIPGRFESFLSGAYIATDPTGTRLVKISSASLSGDEGDVLLVTQTTGARYIGASGSSTFVADTFPNNSPAHAIPSEDGTFSPVVYVLITCEPPAISNSNQGPNGTIKCTFVSGQGVVDPLNDVIWQSVRCGAWGGPDEAVVTLQPVPNGEPADVNGDGYVDPRFKFDSKDTFLSPGDKVVCTGETVADASHIFD